MRRKNCKRLLACVPLLLLSGLTAAQNVADYEFIHWVPAIPDPNLRALRLEDSVVTSLRGHDSHVVEPAARIELLFRANGDVHQSYRSSLQFVDTTGIDQRGNTSVFVDSYAEELFVRQAAVLTADGQAIGVDPATLQVLVEDSGGVFSDVVELVVPWPSLEPGSIVIIDYEIVTRRSRLAAPWSRIFHPRSLTPRAQYELDVRWEPNVSRPSVMTDLAELTCADAGERRIRCNGRDIQAADTDFDVNYVDELPYVVVAENVSWKELARTIGGYVHRSYTDEPAVQRVVDRITAGADGDLQKLKAIHTFVAKEIRYVGIETGTNGIVPRDTGLTLERRFGDCKDKTALFLQMAELAGISAFPVLVSSHRKNLAKVEVPSIAYFDHMVSCGLIGNARFCVDLTDPYTSAEAFPVYLNNAVSLPLLYEADRAVTVPPSRFAWSLNVTSENRFDGGALIEHERREYGGAYSGALRSSLAALNEANLSTWAVNEYQRVSGSDAEPAFKFTALRDQHQPLVVESDVTYPNVILEDTDVHYLHLPGWLSELVGSFETQNEHYAYRFTGFVYRDISKFDIGERPLRALGAAIDFQSDFGVMRRTYGHANGTVTVETIVEMPNRVVALEEMSSFNAFLRVIQENANVRFRFDPRSSAP